MTIEVSCGSCGQKYSIEDSLAGKKARCRSCSHSFVIPALKKEEPELQLAEIDDDVPPPQPIRVNIQNNNSRSDMATMLDEYDEELKLQAALAEPTAVLTSVKKCPRCRCALDPTGKVCLYCGENLEALASERAAEERMRKREAEERRAGSGVAGLAVDVLITLLGG